MSGLSIVVTRALVSIRTAAHKVGCDLQPRGVQPRVRKILAIAGLGDAFGVGDRDAERV